MAQQQANANSQEDQAAAEKASEAEVQKQQALTS